MVVLSVLILFIIFGSSKLSSNALYTYCTLPCPFMCPAQQPKDFGAIQLPPSRPTPIGRSSYYDNYVDYDETDESSQPSTPPPPVTKLRQQEPPDTDPPTSPTAQPKPKPKPPPEEDPEPPAKKRNPSSSSSTPCSPSIQPSRRFFTSLFSIPGAIVDTMISGEITL